MKVLQGTKEWYDMLKVLGKKKMSTKNIVYGIMSFKNEGESNTYQNKQKLRVFITELLCKKYKVLQDESKGAGEQQGTL